MIINHLKLKDFKSFSGEHKLTFDTTPGLCCVRGENKMEPQLGANGSGKSGFFSDGLFWVLFGKTTRNLKASNIHTWGKSGGAYGEVGFSIGSNTYLLKRNWNPNWTKLVRNTDDSIDIDQEALNEVLGIGPDAYQHAILVGQFSQMFFDLQPTQKLALFTSVLGIDNWIDFSSKAAIAVKGIDDDIGHAEHKINNLSGKMAQIKEELKILFFKSEKFDMETVKLIKNANDDIKDIKRELVILSKKHKKVLDKLNAFDSNIEDIQGEILGLEKAVKDLGFKLGSTTSNIQNKRTEIDKIRYNIDRFDRVGPYCNVCKQKVPNKHKKDHKHKLELEKSSLVEDLDIIVDKRVKLKAKFDKKELHIKKLNIKIDDILDANNNIKAQLNSIANSMQSLEQDKLVLKDEISKLKSAPNEFKDMLKTSKIKENKIKDDIKKLNSQLSKHVKRKTATEYWVKGFKNIRLFIVKEALSYLEIEVNNNLVELGLENWNITFEIERETKAGGISKGFNVFIQSPYNNGQIPWESYSGGEGQRLRIAGTLGLSNLILNTLGINTNLLILDEPTAHLSQTGIEDLIECLYNKATTDQKQIWLIDHRTLDYGGFTKTVTVIKDENGSWLKS